MSDRAQHAKIGPRQHAKADDLTVIEPVQQRASLRRLSGCGHVDARFHSDSQS
jgi:hypothetical protein